MTIIMTQNHGMTVVFRDILTLIGLDRGRKSVTEYYSYSDSETHNSSDDDFRQSRDKRSRRRCKTLFRSLQSIKLLTFTEVGNWDSFLIQIERLADRYQWSELRAKERFLNGLKDKALRFARELRHSDYNKFKLKMT